MMINQYQMEAFRVHFPLTRVTVYKDYMTYKTTRGKAELWATMANEMIEKEGLDLVAIPTVFQAQDSFVVKRNDIEL